MYIRSSDGHVLSAGCPRCLKTNTYHIAPQLSLDSLILVAICRNCKNHNKLGRVQLAKKVIYLDQFCIDNIGKVKADKEFKHRNQYEELEKKLNLLVKHQLAIFPTSTFHTQETSYIANSQHRKNTQYVAESLSCDVSFMHPDEILETALLDYLNETNTTSDKILDGKRNNWYAPQYRISLSSNHKDGSFRQPIAESISKRLKGKSLSAEAILDELINDYCNLPLRIGILQLIQKLYKEKNCSLSNALKTIPILRIIAALLAQLSRDFANTRKKPIDKGMASDIIMVAHILPYVDAIFVDQTMSELLNQSKSDYIPNTYKSRIYSLLGKNKSHNFKAFISFLDSIETSNPEYRYPPFIFRHSELVQAFYEKSEAPSPLSKIKAATLFQRDD